MKKLLLAVALLAPLRASAIGQPPNGTQVVVEDGNSYLVYRIFPMTGNATLVATLPRTIRYLFPYHVMTGVNEVTVVGYRATTETLWLFDSRRERDYPNVSAVGRYSESHVVFVNRNSGNIYTLGETGNPVILGTLPAGVTDVSYVNRVSRDELALVADDGRRVMRFRFQGGLTGPTGNDHDVAAALRALPIAQPNGLHFDWTNCIATADGIWVTGTQRQGSLFYAYYDFATRQVEAHGLMMSRFILLDATTHSRALAAVGDDYVALSQSGMATQSPDFFAAATFNRNYGTQSPFARPLNVLVAVDHRQTNQPWLGGSSWVGLAPPSVTAPMIVGDVHAMTPAPPPPENPVRAYVTRFWTELASQTGRRIPDDASREMLPAQLPASLVVALFTQTDLHWIIHLLTREQWATFGIDRYAPDGIRTATPDRSVALVDLVALLPRSCVPVVSSTSP